MVAVQSMYRSNFEYVLTYPVQRMLVSSIFQGVEFSTLRHRHMLVDSSHYLKIW